MAEHVVTIQTITHATHDMLRIVTTRPDNYSFTPGQATDVSINKEGWTSELRSFTFTCLPDSDYLEFNIKTYPAHHGVTNALLGLKQNDELIVHDVFGAIAYKGEGVFIAGGAGITPFIAILRYLQSKSQIGNNKLIFANKTSADIILEQEFRAMLGSNFINILSDETLEGFAHGFISAEFLKQHIANPLAYIYLCGPPPMMDAVEKNLKDLNIKPDNIVKEAF